ncbi:rab11 family-interacting protein 3 isoform X2 [Danio aesculapii]|uniref:rab11 family-interacting protein 3 isoform X2 n=1 Tax=Danio aesculapii TaxID=1142201 RepID=UPI0024BF4B3F|nr:rab11 family-interacting protein 3 isoform X2 [Danio aesculapii]
MEQVLSSPQGCSEWEVSGKTEWESDQNPLGFLLVDKDNSSVADSTKEIFQENAINLDDLFWASQTYSWENGLDCVYPEWKAQPPPSQDLKGDSDSGIPEVVEGDLICFNSRSASPTLADRPVQDQNNLYDHAKQVEVTATSGTLDVCTGELGINAPTLQTDKTLLQETHLMLEESHLTNCEFSCNSGVENENSQNLLPHGTHVTLESEGLLAVSPVEVSFVDTNSNPKPSTICPAPPSASEHIYLSSSALPCEPVFPMTCTKPHVPPFHEGSATLPMDEVEMMLPKFQGEGKSSKPLASNRTHEPQSQDANTDTKHLSVCPLRESDITPEHCEDMLHELSTKCSVEMVEEEVNKESVSSNTTNTAFYKAKTELCEELSSTECTFGVLLETVGEDVKEEAASDSRTDHVFSETQKDLAPVALIDLQAEDPSAESLPWENGQEESKSALPASKPEHNALFELSSGNVVSSENHSQSTFSAQTQALSEVHHDGDLTPDGMLTDSIVCEAVKSIDSVIPSLTDSNELTKQVDCDADSHDFESDALTLEFQNNMACVQTGSIDNNPEEMEKQHSKTIGDTEIPDTFLDLEILDLHQNQQDLKSQSEYLQYDLVHDNSQESKAKTKPCKEQINAQNKENTLVEDLALVDQLKDSLITKLSAIACDDKCEENLTGHDMVQNVKAKPPTDSVELSKLVGCDANSHDFESNELTLEFQNNVQTGIVDDNPKAMEKEIPDTLMDLEISDLHQDHQTTDLKSQLKYLQNNLVHDKNQEPRIDPCQEQSNANPLVEDLAFVDQLNDSLTTKSSAIAFDNKSEENLLSHDTLQDVEAKPTDSFEFTKLLDCDANSHYFESDALTLEFQNNVTNIQTGSVDDNPKAMEKEIPETLTDFMISDLHQNQPATSFKSQSGYLQNDLVHDKNQELINGACQEQISAQNKENFVEDLALVDRLNNSLAMKSSAIAFDNKSEENLQSHDTLQNVKAKPPSDSFEITKLVDCDANSYDFESDALTVEFQNNLTYILTGSVDNNLETLEKQHSKTVDNTEILDTQMDLEISMDLHQNQQETDLKSKLEYLQNDLVHDNNQEPKNDPCQEQTYDQNREETLVEDLALVDPQNYSLTAKSSAIAFDNKSEENLPSHDTLQDVEAKPHSVTLQGGERSDCRSPTRNQVIPHCASNPDSLESTPFTCTDDQLTVTGGPAGLDLSETSSQSGEASGEGEAEYPTLLTHQEDFHQLTPSEINLAQEQQVSSVVPGSSPSHRDVFPCGASLDGEAYLTFMENNPDTLKHAEMTLDLCKASDALPTKSLQIAPVDLIHVPIVSATAHRSEEQSALRAVFQALDQDGDGFVHIEEFIEFAKAYGAEQVKDLTRFLDPSGLGVISFEDFHRGISAISNEGSDPELYKTHFSTVEASGPPEEYDEQAEVSDSAYLGSESAYSECETFTDEDTTALVHPELHEDVETDSGIENTLTDGDDRNRFTLGSDLNGHTVVAVIGGEEEHFEDFGESNNTSDLLLANQEEGRAGPDGEGDAEPLPHSDSPLSRPLMLLSPSSSKRLSSKKAARHLQQSNNLDVMGDLTQDILDLADRDITDKVLLLEKRVCELEKDSLESEEQHARLRQENLSLVHRANALEEQLKEQELRTEEDLLAQTRKHRDALNKLQRERDLEIENLQARLHQLDEENSELRSCVPCLRANIERLEEEKRKLQDEADDVTQRLNEESESRRKMSDKLSHERHTNQKEKECTQGLIEDLRKQLEHLQLFKLETEARRGRSSSNGLQEYNTHMRENELEQEIRRLKQDNRSLKEQNDELNGQIINLSIQGAKSLFTESLSESLAAEINNVSRAELMEAIHKQEEINFRLQDYIDRIIVAIMESNPSILEVK